MRQAFLAKLLSNVLILTVITLNMSTVSGGTGISKYKYKAEFTPEQRSIISNPRYLPYNASDGGRAYFNAWNGVNGGTDFKIFTQKYCSIIENEKSATELKDSDKSNTWSTGPVYGNSFTIENSKDFSSESNYFLRVDYENKIVYTIRKSGNKYLCAFYILHVSQKNADEIKAAITYYFVVSPEGNIKNLLLPVDKKLLE